MVMSCAGAPGMVGGGGARAEGSAAAVSDKLGALAGAGRGGGREGRTAVVSQQELVDGSDAEHAEEVPAACGAPTCVGYERSCAGAGGRGEELDAALEEVFEFEREGEGNARCMGVKASAFEASKGERKRD